MSLSLTLFKTIFDNKTHKRMDFVDWESFVHTLYGLSELPLNSKKDAQLISPAIYKPETTRKNDSVVAWAGWCAVDVDDYVVKGELKDDLYNMFGDWEYVCYSTASSTREKPKFRIVFRLGSHVEASEIRAFWYALNTELRSVGDKQCKDLSRMYYIPATYNNAFNFIFRNDGASIDVDALTSKHPYSSVRITNSFLDGLSPELQAAALEYRKKKLTNTDVHWNSYRDCPFFPKKLSIEYKTIADGGWYYKMYQIMVATAGNATKQEYPITPRQIADLCRELDQETGNWYENRPLEKEADRALEYVYKNM
jgi:hypothetical protein